MPSLLFLTARDFAVQESTAAVVLTTRIADLSLLLHYHSTDPRAHEWQSAFRELPRRLHGCHFGMVSLSTHRDLETMSKRTTTPLPSVHEPPNHRVILYAQGKPCMAYKGPPDCAQIETFITEVVAILNRTPEDPAEIEAFTQRSGRALAMTTLGVPLYGCDDLGQYLAMDKAYITITPDRTASLRRA